VADLIPNFAFPIPFLVICELLGLPDEDRDTFRKVANARFDVSKGSKIAFGAASRSREFFLDVVRRQRVEPGDGLIGAILTELGDSIDDVTLSGLADGVFLGGVESSATMLTLGTLVLLEHPAEIQAMLAGGPAAAVAVVDELLRYLAVVQVAFPRFAKSDMTIAGRDVKAGDVLICSLSGANRDPALGADLDRFDPHRGPTSHMAFGHGFHRCVGAELAKMELRAAYPALFSRFPELRLQGKVDSLKYRKLSLVFGIESLPVHLGQSVGTDSLS
jgi:cytochrome P450